MEKVKLIIQKANLMGSPFEIRVYWPLVKPLQLCRSWIALAFGEIRRIENLLTDFRASPFNEINQMAGVRPVKVPKEVFDIIEKSFDLSRNSEGAFDISYASIGHLWRDANQKGVPPNEDEIESLKPYVDYRKIILDERQLTVYLPHKKMRIGLGGIGKGYAVDRAYDLLLGLGVKNFSVNGAGDIRVHSEVSAPRQWRVGIRNPFEKKNVPMGALALRNGAVATSGDYERFFRYQGIKYHHVLDGRSGEIARGVVSVTVLGRTSLVADTVATTVMSLGEVKGLHFLNTYRNLSGFLVTHDGRVLKSNSLEKPFQPLPKLTRQGMFAC